ncbi:MAG: DUF4231 domain-containing protein [Mollicutes bacterium PWAP]|nr:DUF4231 domain-containing protein [Mollicutes bacterium PWAP]
MEKALSYFNILKQKKKRSNAIFIILNVLIYLFIAGLVVLNLFTIRLNPTDDDKIKWIFVAISILFAIISFLVSIMSFFGWRNKARDSREKYEEIELEIIAYKKEVDIYEKTKEKDAIFFDRIIDILG